MVVAPVEIYRRTLMLSSFYRLPKEKKIRIIPILTCSELPPAPHWIP